MNSKGEEMPTAIEDGGSRSNHEPRVVLVVDDDSSHRWMLGEALRAADFDVH